MKLLKSRNSKDGVPFRVVETFSGIGAQAMALRTSSEPQKRGGERRTAIPYKVVATSDISRHANAAYDAINADTGWNPENNLGDITRITKLPDCDILTYSFCCQSLSKANTSKNKGMKKDSGTQSSLLWYLEDLIRQSRPEWLLMENVTQIHNRNNVQDFQRWIDTLSEMGYTSKWADLDASKFGVPQKRRRCFLLSHFGATCPDLPTGVNPAPPLSDILEGGSIPGYDLSADEMAKRTYDGKSKGHRKVLPWRNADSKGYRDAEEGDGLECQFIGSARGTVKKGISPTILCSGDAVGVCVRREDGDLTARRFTPKETWRLQGFPDWAFNRVKDLGQSDRQLYEESGNSIAVPVLREIFHTIDQEDIRLKSLR